MSEPISVTIKLFAMIRESVGVDQIKLTLSGNPVTVLMVREHMLSEYPLLMPILSFSQIAVNEELADDGTVLSEGDEVAILPPVSGG